MLKNKIYKYFFNEILKNFTIILLTFAAIAWVVRAVNFLDLMVEDGYGSTIYFKYSLLNITTIISRFVPLAFLLSLTISVVKFERQKELLILWTTGLAKIRIVNIFLLIGLVITIFQLLLSILVNPFLLNKSRSLLSQSNSLEINTVLRSNNFSDTFKNITFYIESKNKDNELENIFIKDENGSLSTIINEPGDKKDTTIIARKGFIVGEKLILFNGILQSLNERNEIKNIYFEKTELSLDNAKTRTIKRPKIQETSSLLLLNCIFSEKVDVNINNCSSKGDYKTNVAETLSRRLGAPLYIPLISVITSFLLIFKKEKTYGFLKKYILFILSFIMLILAEIFLKYTGLSLSMTLTYFIMPITLTFGLYLYLLRKILTEKILK
jgi:lipopolysaccharide export system permease protein